MSSTTPAIRRTKNTRYVGLAYMKGYRVLRDGRVRSGRGRILKQSAKHTRGPVFSLHVSTAEGSWTVATAQLLAFQLYGLSAFHEGTRIMYRDGNPNNVTPRNVVLSRVPPTGGKFLTAPEVRSIRLRWQDRKRKPITRRELADQHRVSINTIHKVIRKDTYAWVDMTQVEPPRGAPIPGTGEWLSTTAHQSGKVNTDR